MSTKFSEDVVPLGDLKANPSRIIRQTTETHRPVLLTNRGRGVAVVQSINDYEKGVEAQEFMRAVVTGLTELESGQGLPHEEVKKRLKLS